MSLFELIDNTRTDKNTIHSYLDIYQKLFEEKKYTAKNVLEVGIGYPPTNGGSIKLWYDFFKNANIYGIDIIPINDIWDKIINVKDENHEIILHASCNAYDENWFNENFLNKDIKFDIVIDDGIHTLESMIYFIKLYSKLLTTNGLLIIEDIQDIRWINILKSSVPEHLKKYIEVYDIRDIKNRHDDIMFVINLNKNI